MIHKLLFFILTLIISVGFSSAQINNEFAVYNVDELVDGEFLHDFLVIGPFPNPLANGVQEYYLNEDCLGFFIDYLKPIGGEVGVMPREGKVVQYGSEGKENVWQAYRSSLFKVDFKQIFQPNDHEVAYAACWIKSDRDQEKLFGLGTNDGVKVWLNGELIHINHRPRIIEIDDDYLRLKLNKGKNLLLLKIDNGGGRWGFALRPVNEAIAWQQMQNDLAKELFLELKADGDSIRGVLGDPYTTAHLHNLPNATLVFKSLQSGHINRITARLGSKLSLPQSEFPDEDYSIEISVPVDTGIFTFPAYLSTSGNVIRDVRRLLYTDLPDLPETRNAEYFRNTLATLQWMDQADKFFNHSYAYRRYKEGLENIHSQANQLARENDPLLALFPKPQQISRSNSVAVLSKDWEIFDPEKTDDFISAEIDRVWNLVFKQSAVYSKKRDKNIIHLNISNDRIVPDIEGGYVLQITRDRVDILAKTRQGLFYGIDTFLQLVQQTTHLPTCEIRDWPAFLYRGSYEPTPSLTEEYKQTIDRLARLRYNMVYNSSNFAYLNDEKKLSDLKKVFAYCKSRFIEPIPYVETFGGHTFTRLIDPCLDEGIFHDKEKWSVPESGKIKLNSPRILDCQTSTLHIFSKMGDELTRDIDYTLLSAEPPLIRIDNPSYINSTVFLSYDAIDFAEQKFPASCPSDPRAWEIEREVIGRIFEHFQPRYFHIGQDEAGYVNTCSRCLSRGLSNKEIMIDEINRVYGIVREFSKDVEIHMWGDLFNDYQNAILLKAKGCGEGIPKDIVQLDWRYTAVTHYERMAMMNQMKYFFDLGLRVVGVSWWEPANVMDILISGDRKPSNFLGVMHTAWGGLRGGLMTTAEANWNGKVIWGRLDF